MAVSPDDLARIDTWLAPAQADDGRDAGGRATQGAVAEPPAPAEFRARFPGLTLTRCDVSDVGNEPPFREYPSFNLYLVDGADHCWKLTTEPARATGIVVARRRA
jgi:hypothetical protein